MIDTNEVAPVRVHSILGLPDESVEFKKTPPVEQSGYPGFAPGTRVLPAGSVHRQGGQPLAVDVLEERDVALTLRDGTTIYTDVFRPVGEQPVPVILAWSPYGKRGGKLNLDVFPERAGVPEEWEDGLDKFESVNPGYWVSHGYAVANVDPRGVFASDGDIHLLGRQEAEDEYDTIEWLAAQPWSTGKVALAGNSWLAMAQWFVAALKPPHLAAIAPWEGANDIYRHSAARGGILDDVFPGRILGGLSGNGYTEDQAAAAVARPLYDAYWDSKRADLEAIEVPAYIAASWTNIVHGHGTLEGWRRISSPQKWLRVHNTHEWHDFYTPAHVDDLRRFFDYILKGADNGWEATPPVRLSVLDPGHTDLVDRAESAYPLARQQWRTLFLDAESGALGAAPAQSSDRAYEPDADGIVFRHTFDDETEINGYGKVRLWVSAEDADDLDVFVYLTKIDADGTERQPEIIPGRFHVGPNGRLRASLRELDAERSTASEPFHPFTTVHKLAPGEIVALDIPLWPYAMRFHAGETLQLRVNGEDLLVRPEFPKLPRITTLNRGRHVVYTGGEHDSHLLLPVVAS